MRAAGMVILSIALAVVGCSDDDSPYGNGGGTPGANEVWMQSSSFNPGTLTVSSGTTVTFVNKVSATHNVISSSVPSGATNFSSGNMSINATYQVALTVAGTYQYYCSHHGSPTAGMRGTIVVN